MIEQMSGGAVTAAYLEQLLHQYQGVPPNLRHHLQLLDWDRARVDAARGPLDRLLRALQDPQTAPDALRAMAVSLATSFDGWGARRHLLDPTELVRSHMEIVRGRMGRRQPYPYGVEGLDQDEDGKWRFIPGAEPGLVTTITGLSGSGKSTVAAIIALGLISQGRRVLYGAWEMKGNVTLELMAAINLGLSRTKLRVGEIVEEEFEKLRDEMTRLSDKVRFMNMPFGRTRGEKVSNDKNLDLLHGYIADSGCDVAIFDLWKRCLRYTDPDDEEQALIRQQAIFLETGVHGILVQQQRLKDVEQRKDKRPTREAIKGSGAWIEVPDTIIGVHRHGLWKSVDDDSVELIVLKQREGVWPQAVEFKWSGEYGRLSEGRTIAYDPNPEDDFLDKKQDVGAKGGKGRNVAQRVMGGRG